MHRNHIQLKKTAAELAIEETNNKKLRKDELKGRGAGISDHWLRKSLHFRVLPRTYKELRKFVVDEEISVAGILEYFACKLIDKDEAALAFVRDYKHALKNRGYQVAKTDVLDIIKMIEENNPFNEELVDAPDEGDYNDDETNQ